MNCELWLWLYLWEIWWFACVAKCNGQQCPAIRIEGTMREFTVTNTLRELSSWPKMNTCELWNCSWWCWCITIMEEKTWNEWIQKNLAKWTCVVRNELVFVATNYVVYSESTFAAEYMLSVVRIRCSLPNCVFHSESGVPYQICVVSSESCVPCRICVVSSESGVRCRIVLSVANQVFAVELCIPWRIRSSLPNLCCQQRIKCSLPNCVFYSRIRCSLLNCVFHNELCVRWRTCVVRSKSGVHCWIVYSAVNLCSLSKLCCL